MDLFPGDVLVVSVPSMPIPEAYSLPSGTYRLRIVRPLTKRARPGGNLNYVASYLLGSIVCYVGITLSDDERMNGYLFIAGDQHPVPFIWEPSLGARLKASVKEASK